MATETGRYTGRVGVIGDPARVRGYALAGAAVHECAEAEAARSAWASLGDDVVVVVLTQAAAEAIGDRQSAGVDSPLKVVLPV